MSIITNAKVDTIRLIMTMIMIDTMALCLTKTMQLTMTYITFTGWLSYAGCYAASLSSAIASLIGAPRILQVLLKQQFKCDPIGFRPWGRTGSTLALVGLKKEATPTTIQSEVGAELLVSGHEHFSQVTSYVLPLRWAL